MILTFRKISNTNIRKQAYRIRFFLHPLLRKSFSQTLI